MGSIRDLARQTVWNTETVRVPEWDIDVEVRSITVKQRAELVDGGTDNLTFGPRLVVASVYDPESGEPAFTSEDVDLLVNLPAGLVDTLIRAAMRVSRLTDDDSVESGKDDS